MNQVVTSHYSNRQVNELVTLQRFIIKIGGESGQGINSIGEIFAKVFKNTGWQVFGYREYPSLIKGGYSSFQIDVSDQPLVASSEFCDVLVCLSRVTLHKYLNSVRPGGTVIHSLPRFELTDTELEFVTEHQIHVTFVPADTIAIETGGKHIMANTVMTGIICRLLNLNLSMIEGMLREEFASKPQVLDINIACLKAGHEFELEVPTKIISFKTKPDLAEQFLLTGNHTIGLGAVAGGVRAYYAYPMTPSSSILSYLASIYHQTGMFVKQIEDEISVAQMAIGSMHMGTRALVSTSGGGFDLMTESVSLAAMAETPFVCVLGQRPGPATGLPTWTATGDLNLAIYAGHGEFARCVLAASDPLSCYELVQKALNIAEKFQTPVIVLTDKEIAESLFMIGDLPEPLPIERHLVNETEIPDLKPSDRYRLTPTGVSPRWLPGQSPAVYDANGDEHLADGALTEEAQPVKDMFEKRMRKHEALLADLPEPILYGPHDADITFVGWSSVKNPILDVMRMAGSGQLPVSINYLHYESMFPLKTETFLKLTKTAQRLVLIENNYLGQLGQLITQNTGYQFKERMLKYDGRPFFVEDILEFVLAHRKGTNS